MFLVVRGNAFPFLALRLVRPAESFASKSRGPCSAGRLGGAVVDAQANPGLAREALEAIIKDTPFTVGLGVQLTRYAAGEVEVRLPVQPHFTQHHGFVHGALVGFMADTACAWVAASVAGDVVTAEYKLNLLAPAVGEALIARGVVVKAGARQVVTRADVFAVRDSAERIVATALATIARV